ncbi:MAG: DUF4325 domain-containing protein [Ignavibacteria bacterium]|nr:DUF4325 domain-containing protein [Ignavibacteria bacterium]
MKINLFDLIGEYCITLQGGEDVYELIHPELMAGRQVELDFLNVGVFASPFFNAAIGRLLEDLKSDDLNQLLKISNLNDVGNMVLRRVIENSKEYYSNPTLRNALDEIVAQHAEA